MVAQRERVAQANSLFDEPPETAQQAVLEVNQPSHKGSAKPSAKGSRKGSAKPGAAATPATDNSGKSVSSQSDNCVFDQDIPETPKPFDTNDTYALLRVDEKTLKSCSKPDVIHGFIKLQVTMNGDEYTYKHAAKMREDAARDATMIRDQRYFMREVESCLTRIKSILESVDGTQPIVDELQGYIKRCFDLPYKPVELAPNDSQQQQQLAADNARLLETLDFEREKHYEWRTRCLKAEEQLHPLTARHDQPQHLSAKVSDKKRIEQLEHDAEIMHASKIYQDLHPDWGLVELQAENIHQREQIVTILDSAERKIAELEQQVQEKPAATTVDMQLIEQQFDELRAAPEEVEQQWREKYTALEEDRDQLQVELDERDNIIDNQADQIAKFLETNRQPSTTPVAAASTEELTSVRTELERVRESEQRYKDFQTWTLDLYHNPTIPNGNTKLVLWYFYYLFFTMRPQQTGETMQIGVKATAEALGIGEGTVRNATDKAEMWDVLKRDYEDIKFKDGSKITLANITLHDIMNDPNQIAMEKQAGGKRTPRCPRCGSENVDRYTVQYCRECNKNDWYGQPGLRKDADVAKAQHAENMPLYTGSDKSGKNQVGFYASPDEMPDVPENDTQPSAKVDAHHTLPADHHHENPVTNLLEARQARTGKTSKNQVGFYTSPQAMPDVPVKVVEEVEEEEHISTHCECGAEVSEYGPDGTAYCEQHAPHPQAEKQQHPVDTQHPAQPVFTIPDHWIKEGVAQNTPVCRAQSSLNKEGKRAGALEKAVKIVECGSTRWIWSPELQKRICANPECRAPLPE